MTPSLCVVLPSVVGVPVVMSVVAPEVVPEVVLEVVPVVGPMSPPQASTAIWYLTSVGAISKKYLPGWSSSRISLPLLGVVTMSVRGFYGETDTHHVAWHLEGLGPPLLLTCKGNDLRGVAATLARTRSRQLRSLHWHDPWLTSGSGSSRSARSRCRTGTRARSCLPPCRNREHQEKGERCYHSS